MTKGLAQIETGVGLRLSFIAAFERWPAKATGRATTGEA